jgi:hypothetical protein
MVLLSSLLTLGAFAAFAQTPATPAATSTAATVSGSATSTDALREYTGTYTFASGSPIPTYTVSVEGGDLYGSAREGNKFKMLKQEKADQYKSTSSYGSIITFQRDATTKAVTGLTLAAQDQDFTATKDK